MKNINYNDERNRHTNCDVVYYNNNDGMSNIDNLLDLGSHHYYL